MYEDLPFFSSQSLKKRHFRAFLWRLITVCSLYQKVNLSLLSVTAQSDVSGPVFVQEPPNQVDFSNTTGAEIICQSRGTPLPKITWVKTDGTIIKDVPGLRQVGSIIKECFYLYSFSLGIEIELLVL